MRLSTLLPRVGVFVLAAVFCVISARIAVAVVEDRSRMGVQEALIDAGHDWASVQADGLNIVIEGEAPNEAKRFNAMTAAGTVVDSARVIDNMSVTDSSADAVPEFGVEMLRNDEGIMLIGLIPRGGGREIATQRIARISDGGPVVDLMDVASYSAPEAWKESFDFALYALRLLPRSKVSVMAGSVEISAVADSELEKAYWEQDLRERLPSNVDLGLAISAPRPVITPFVMRFSIDEKGAQMPACSADTEEDQTRILTAARTAGLSGDADCPLGLGVPSKTWADAGTLAIAAVADLGGGTVTLSDADVTLIAIEGTSQETFDEVVGRLQNALPDVFSLDATLPETPEPGQAGPPEFVATLSPEGLAQLRGRIDGEMMNQTAETYAKARFGQDVVDMRTRIVEDGSLPSGWSVRVLAGIEALSHLASGAVVVQPDHISVTGRTGSKTAQADISRLLIAKLGADASFEVAASYSEALDPLAGLPTPEECVAKIVAINEASKITFEPGSDTIAVGGRSAMDDIADTLRKCPELALQVAGYTDSQGREEMNQALSQRRADAVLAALRARRIPTASFKAIGFGEADPIADNGTEEGREANRRIEFSLVSEAGEDDTDETAADGSGASLVAIDDEDAPEDGDAAQNEGEAEAE